MRNEPVETRAEIYFSCDRYDALVNALVAAGADLDKIKLALGLAGDIWPASIVGDDL